MVSSDLLISSQIHLNSYQMGRKMKKDSDKIEYIFLRTSQQLSSYKSNSRIHQQEPWDCALVWRDKWMEGQIKMDCGKDRWVDGGERQWPWWAKLVHHVWSVLTMLMATVAFSMQSIWKRDCSHFYQSHISVQGLYCIKKRERGKITGFSFTHIHFQLYFLC